jgi:hypothetical protein
MPMNGLRRNDDEERDEAGIQISKKAKVKVKKGNTLRFYFFNFYFLLFITFVFKIKFYAGLERLPGKK